MIQMTKQQTKAIEMIRSAMLAKGAYELKEEHTKNLDYFVSYSIEMGIANDDGTLASVICRDYRHFFIGKRGGIKLQSVLMSNKYASPKNVTGLFNSINYLPF